ncbi:MAG TPA: rhomboid family intramembrane serine protease [Catalimonadaceae bacterium]|nr:rhomboid family intramembrane serine protease [Catalimonadaceae bacterium]
MKSRTRTLLLPSLLILPGLTVVYSLLHWLLILKLHLFEVKEDIIQFGIPVVLSGLVTWFGLRPRLDVLRLDTKQGSHKNDLYCLVFWIMCMVPMIMTQMALPAATGKLISINSLKEIPNFPEERYFAPKQVFFRKSAPGIHIDSRTTGKNDEELKLMVFVAIPGFSSPEDSLFKSPPAWLGIEFDKTISNDLQPTEKQSALDNFLIECQAEYDRKNPEKFTYLKKLPASDDRDMYHKARDQQEFYHDTGAVLIPVNEPFEERNGNMLFWITGVLSGSMLIWLLMVLIPKTNHLPFETESSDYEWQDDPSAPSSIPLYIPQPGFFITPILIYLNLAVYLLMALSGFGFLQFQADDLMKMGANFRPDTIGGEWWRLLTSVFLHGGLLHLLANMYGLFFIGSILEPLLGRTRFLGAYLICGIIASLASIGWYEATVSVGASGAIFGMYGLFLALLLAKIFHPEFAQTFLSSTLIFVGFNLLMGFQGGIDNAAHIGGLVSGFAIGWLLKSEFRPPDDDMQTNPGDPFD